jgi:hypothetical protein
MTERRKCIHIRDNGQQCAATPQRNSAYCFAHDPAKSDARNAARRRGGINSHGKFPLVVDARATAPESAEDIKRLLGELVAKVQQGQIDPRTMDAIQRTLKTQLQAIQVADIERRLAQIEQRTEAAK